MPPKSHKMPDGSMMSGTMPKPVKGKSSSGLSDKQKEKLPVALQQAILKSKKGKKKI